MVAPPLLAQELKAFNSAGPMSVLLSPAKLGS